MLFAVITEYNGLWIMNYGLRITDYCWATSPFMAGAFFLPQPTVCCCLRNMALTGFKLAISQSIITRTKQRAGWLRYKKWEHFPLEYGDYSHTPNGLSQSRYIRSILRTLAKNKRDMTCIAVTCRIRMEYGRRKFKIRLCIYLVISVFHVVLGA